MVDINCSNVSNLNGSLLTEFDQDICFLTSEFRVYVETEGAEFHSQADVVSKKIFAFSARSLMTQIMKSTSIITMLKAIESSQIDSRDGIVNIVNSNALENGRIFDGQELPEELPEKLRDFIHRSDKCYMRSVRLVSQVNIDDDKTNECPVHRYIGHINNNFGTRAV